MKHKTADVGRAVFVLPDRVNDILMHLQNLDAVQILREAAYGDDLLFDEYLNHKADGNVIRYFQNARILATIKKEQLTYTEQFTPEQLQAIKTKVQENGYVDFSKNALDVIGKNRSRNTAIMNKLRELSAEQVPTIVFACSVAHAKLLSFMLSLEDIPNTLVLGEMNSVDRAEAIAAFKDRENPINILINYEVLTTGFDSTNIRWVLRNRHSIRRNSTGT